MSNFSCYDREYLIKSIFGNMSKKKQFAEIVSIISYAVLNNDEQSYEDASCWFEDRGHLDWANHFNKISLGIQRQKERLYRSQNVYQ
jgi:hypothetical protein